MNLICNKCKHQWEEKVDVGQQVVLCPECFSIVPLVLAQKGKAEPTPPTASRPVEKTKILGTPQPKQRTVPPDVTRKLPETPPKQPTQTIDKTRVLQEHTVTPVSPSPSDSKIPTEIQQLIGKNIDGYRIEQLLGMGGMGAVFLAHQVSLDRKVALKVLPARLSRDPNLIVRFTREALSAAQLNHHNIVQVYDVGNVGDIYYISMEYVIGENIGDIIRKEGRLQIDDAAGYVLQAARGLKYSHERGIIHRDIKPDNLMLNEHGIVKIADMGLAKWRKDITSPKKAGIQKDVALQQKVSVDLTMDNIAMGTPAYMSPEQARDAATVDERADQYSLGCTLYYMCAGKAPYSGTTVFELISKHLNEPLTPLDVHVRGVPPAFSKIIERMLEKNPKDRYPGMSEVIEDLEAYLGVESEKGVYTPREHHLAILENEQKNYYAVPSIKKLKLANLVFFSLMLFLILLALFGGNFALMGGFLGLLLITLLSNFIINGFLTKDYIFRRARSVFFGMPLKNWFALSGGILVAIAALHLLGWIFYWIFFAFIAIALTIAYQISILKLLRAERQGSIENVQQTLKELRLRGVAEEALHDFVCRFSGSNWEEFFEEFFGYENMIMARGKWATMNKVKTRKKFAVWRDPISRWLEGIEEARKEAREKRQLTKAEARRLKAQGVSEKEAEHQAEVEAERIIKKGLIKQVPKEVPIEETRPKHRFTFVKNIANLDFIFRIICFIFSVAVLLTSSAKILPKYGIEALTFIQNYIPNNYYIKWGYGGTKYAVLAGFLLFLMTFSCRKLLRFFVLIGVILLISTNPIINLVDQPQLNNSTAFWGGIALVLGGFGINLLITLSGDKF